MPSELCPSLFSLRHTLCHCPLSVPTPSWPFTPLTAKQWSPPLSPDLGKSHKVPSCPPSFCTAPSRHTQSLMGPISCCPPLWLEGPFPVSVSSCPTPSEDLCLLPSVKQWCFSESVTLAFSLERCSMSELIPPQGILRSVIYRVPQILVSRLNVSGHPSTPCQYSYILSLSACVMWSWPSPWGCTHNNHESKQTWYITVIVLHFLHTSILNLCNMPVVGDVIPVLQIRKLRIRKAKGFTKSCTFNQEIWD